MAGVSPFIVGPLSDFVFLLLPRRQQNLNDPFCSKIESRYMDCLEAYGIANAREKCAELIYDMVECSHQTVQKKRVEIMLKERIKQYKEGKLSKPYEEHPPLDSYLNL